MTSENSNNPEFNSRRPSVDEMLDGISIAAELKFIYWAMQTGWGDDDPQAALVFQESLKAAWKTEAVPEYVQALEEARAKAKTKTQSQLEKEPWQNIDHQLDPPARHRFLGAPNSRRRLISGSILTAGTLLLGATGALYVPKAWDALADTFTLDCTHLDHDANFIDNANRAFEYNTQESDVEVVEVQPDYYQQLNQATSISAAYQVFNRQFLLNRPLHKKGMKATASYTPETQPQRTEITDNVIDHTTELHSSQLVKVKAALTTLANQFNGLPYDLVNYGPIDSISLVSDIEDTGGTSGIWQLSQNGMVYINVNRIDELPEGSLVPSILWQAMAQKLVNDTCDGPIKLKYQAIYDYDTPGMRAAFNQLLTGDSILSRADMPAEAYEAFVTRVARGEGVQTVYQEMNQAWPVLPFGGRDQQLADIQQSQADFRRMIDIANQYSQRVTWDLLQINFAKFKDLNNGRVLNPDRLFADARALRLKVQFGLDEPFVDYLPDFNPVHEANSQSWISDLPTVDVPVGQQAVRVAVDSESNRLIIANVENTDAATSSELDEAEVAEMSKDSVVRRAFSRLTGLPPEQLSIIRHDETSETTYILRLQPNLGRPWIGTTAMTALLGMLPLDDPN